MKVLVTGGIGYIGSHTCVELIEAGYDVVVLDNLSNSHPAIIDAIEEITSKRIPLYVGDVRDSDVLDKVFTENEIDSVIHFAALKCVPESVRMPVEYYDCNVGGTISIIKAMKKYGVTKFVFSSSATVYGADNPVPFKEDFPLSATSPYGMTKVAMERILTDTANADENWSVALLRYFNPIGAHKSGLIGDNPQGIPNNLFPYIARVAAGIYPELSVFGNDYNTPDGTGVRDYIHVVDLARGHVAALDYLETHKGAEAINLGAGHGYSVLEVLHAFEKAVGHKLPFKFMPRRAGDIDEMCAHTEKAEKLLSYKTKYGIDEMCEDGWRYTKKFYGIE